MSSNQRLYYLYRKHLLGISIRIFSFWFVNKQTPWVKGAPPLEGGGGGGNKHINYFHVKHRRRVYFFSPIPTLLLASTWGFCWGHATLSQPPRPNSPSINGSFVTLPVDSYSLIIAFPVVCYTYYLLSIFFDWFFVFLLLFFIIFFLLFHIMLIVNIS